MTGRLAAVHGGSLPERRVLDEPRYARWFAETIYLPDLADADLDRVDALYVPEGSHRGQLEAAAGRIRALLERGGTVIAFGDQQSAWLPGLDWEFRRAGASGPLVADHAEYGFHRNVTTDDATWHHHGVFHPPDGAQTLLAAHDGAAVLYVDQVSTPGTILVSSLDPVSHYGSTFLPAAARFLDCFLPWAATDLVGPQDSRPRCST